MSFDWRKVTASNEAYCRKLAAKPVAEKLRMLDAMRESAMTLGRATVNKPALLEKTIGELVGRDGVFIDGDWVESKDQDPRGDVRLIQLVACIR